MKKKILVVDDNSEIVDLLKNRLEFNHFDVIVTMEGTEVVEKVKEMSPDLVLMDIMMPHMDGDEVAKNLRKEGLKVPVIFVTAHLTTEHGDLARRGILINNERFGVIGKPINPKELLDKINQELGVC